MNLTNYQYAVFDCDGVILDSNHLKTEAFVFTLENEPKELVNEFVEYHKHNGGVSRYVKFDYFYRQLKKISNAESYIEKALERFSQNVIYKMMSCEEIPGIREILSYLNQLQISCYVVSGGDEKELKKIFAQRDLTKYFNRIYGSPKSKFQIMDEVCASTRDGEKGIYFGDAELDLRIANSYELDFVFIRGCSEWKVGYEKYQNLNLISYENFKELMKCL